MFFFSLFQSDDYISIRMGAAGGMDDTIGSLLLGGHLPGAIPIIDEDGQDPKILVEAQLPPYPNLTPSNGSWQSVGNTR